MWLTAWDPPVLDGQPAGETDILMQDVLLIVLSQNSLFLSSHYHPSVTPGSFKAFGHQKSFISTDSYSVILVVHRFPTLGLYMKKTCTCAANVTFILSLIPFDCAVKWHAMCLIEYLLLPKSHSCTVSGYGSILSQT